MIVEPQPSILFIMTDQLIPLITGAYGHKVIQPPIRISDPGFVLVLEAI